MYGYIMVIWALVTSRISVTRAQWSCRGDGGGGTPPLPGEKSMGDYLKYKNQYHFQYDTTKSLSISEVIHNNKIINLYSKLLFYSHFAF